MDPHRLSERRSLELHRMVAEQCRRSPQLYERALAVFKRWQTQGALAPAIAAQWERLFAAGLDVTLAAIVREGEQATHLRSSSPFSVLVAPKERWALTKRLKENRS